jgi:hypothetical protein
MSIAAGKAAVPIPYWLIAAGSLAIAAHLLAVLCMALAVRTEPMQTPFGGDSQFAAPKFAELVNDTAMPNYLRFLKMTQNYHFASNHPGVPDVMFEVRLKDAQGKEMEVLKFPDPKANFWVRHRQRLLARGLANDQPIEPLPNEPVGEVIAAPGKQLEKVQFWDGPDEHHVHIRNEVKHLVPRDRPIVTGPTQWSLLLAQSYARYLCRSHGAASAEISRRMRNNIPPMILYEPTPPPPGLFDDYIAFFGEFRQ